MTFTHPKIITIGDYTLSFTCSFPAIESTSHSKNYRYGQESYFQESLHDFRSLFGNDFDGCQHFTYALLKPDCFVTGSADRCIDIFKKNGCKVVGGSTIHFDRHTVRELWRYEYNTARVARYRLIDELLCGGPSLLVLMRVDDLGADRDASAYVTKRKGRNVVAHRRPESIRSQILARDGTLNFIHTPDELIDTVREFGVLLGDGERKNALEELKSAADREGEVRSMIGDLAKQYTESHSLNFDEVAARLGADFNEFASEQADVLRFDPHSLRAEMTDLFGVTKWDWITLVNRYLAFSDESVPRVFEFEVAA